MNTKRSYQKNVKKQNKYITIIEETLDPLNGMGTSRSGHQTQSRSQALLKNEKKDTLCVTKTVRIMFRWSTVT